MAGPRGACLRGGRWVPASLLGRPKGSGRRASGTWPSGPGHLCPAPGASLGQGSRGQPRRPCDFGLDTCRWLGLFLAAGGEWAAWYRGSSLHGQWGARLQARLSGVRFVTFLWTPAWEVTCLRGQWLRELAGSVQARRPLGLRGRGWGPAQAPSAVLGAWAEELWVGGSGSLSPHPWAAGCWGLRLGTWESGGGAPALCWHNGILMTDPFS